MDREVLLKLLEWPFLFFLALALLVLLFRQQFLEILGRGDITFTWGDRSIRLRELSESLDKELAPIREEIKALRDEVEALSGVQKPKEFDRPGYTDLSENERLDVLRRIREALASEEWRWRSVERLAVEAGIPENKVLTLLRSDPEVKLGADKAGRRLAKLETR
jgi:hypothetical protein